MMVGETALSGRYEAYPEYKDSGVEWLGLIPTEWELWKLNHAFDEIGSGTTPPSGSDEWYGGDVPWVTTGELRETEIVSTTKKITQETLRRFPTLRKYPKGAIAIAMYGATIGRLGIFGIEATTNQACCVLAKSSVVDNKYLYYWLQAFRQDIVSLASGGGQPNINQEVVASLKISSPDVTGQRKIANFLDHETTKIDTLIDKQQQLITLLKEKRQAVISHAVTKGLNPHAPMRDSGVEWLGEVPAHWSVSQVGHCAFVTKLTGFEYTKLWQIDEDGKIIALRGFNVKERKLELNDVERISTDLSATLARTKLAKGDIVFPCTGTIGNAAMVEEDDRFHINQNIAKIRFDATVSARFAIYWLTSSFTRTIIDRNNTSGMQPVVLIGDIRKLPIPRFDYLEQEIVADYLDAIVDRFNILISNAESAITLMKERRTALISAAVTGKIDVRNWKAA